MKKLLNFRVGARLLLPLLLIGLLGIFPRPKSSLLWMQQIRLAAQSGNWQTAAKDLAKAAEMEPESGHLWELSGRYALAGSDPQSAIQYLLQAGSLSTDGKLALGDAYQAAGNLPAAVQAWQSTLPSIQAYRRLVDTYQLLGDIPAAIADLKDLLVLQPNDPEIYRHLGELLAATQPDAAAAYLTQAAALDSSYAEQAGSLQKAIEAGRLSSEPAFTYLSVGRAFALYNEWEYAAAAFQQATIVRPDYAEAWAFWGEAWQHIQQGNHDQGGALTRLQHAIGIDPDSVSANIFLAVYYQRQASFEQAIPYLEKAASLDPQNPSLQSQLGGLLAANGDLAGAQAAYQIAAQLSPNDPTYWRMLARFCLDHDYAIHDTGLPAARQALLIAPDSPESLDLVGQALLQLGDSLNAERFLQRALAKGADYAPAHLHLGMYYLVSGQFNQAAEQLTLAVSLAGDTPVGVQATHLLDKYYP